MSIGQRLSVCRASDLSDQLNLHYEISNLGISNIVILWRLEIPKFLISNFPDFGRSSKLLPPGRRGFYKMRTIRCIGDLKSTQVYQPCDLFQFGIVNLLGCISRGVVVGMKTREKEYRWNSCPQKRPLVAASHQVFGGKIIAKMQGEIRLSVLT